MNTAPIETARDPDLRLSVFAMERAALRARELARQTATSLVVSRNGIIELRAADQLVSVTPSAQEPTTGYKTE
jgi:hypothetical protein